jgi:DNA polymerase elongation subunit (family B)
MSSQNRLIIDIETVGVEFESLDEVSKDQLQKYFERYSKNEEEIEESKDKLGFWPLTGEIVAIGVLNPDTDKGVVYVQNKKSKLPEEIEDGIKIETGDEKGILKKFWDAAEKYNCFITFNGRAFDAPYLMIRSAINGLRPTKNLMTNRYISSQSWEAVHIDLADQLTFYGAARRNFSLHFWARAFGIKSPKESGVTGDDVKRLFNEGKFMDIAKYNLGDLRATKALYEKWRDYLNF